eukprot:GILJ01006904.1.p1 GENE.GILJ01006904.1~~GILJ01006904.1.p1  ORF type:complete len:1209 (+),score=121.47 GILJ01006904.1:195-3821(+)
MKTLYRFRCLALLALSTALVSATYCGDGIRDSVEECDDANLINSDGCSSYCMVESGYTCVPASGRDSCTTSNTPSVISTRFNSYFSSIRISFSSSGNLAGMTTNDCSTLLTDVSTIGTGAYCTWDENDFVIILGSSATIAINGPLSIRGSVLKLNSETGTSAFSTANVIVLQSTEASTLNPQPQIYGPINYGKCDSEIYLDSFGSFNFGPKTPTTVWSSVELGISSGTTASALPYLQAVNTVNETLFATGSTYAVYFAILYPFDVSATTYANVSVTANINAYPTPQVFFLQGNNITIYKSTNLTLNANVTLPTCYLNSPPLPGESTYTYSWFESEGTDFASSGTTVSGLKAATTDSYTLYIPGNTLLSNQYYRFGIFAQRANTTPADGADVFTNATILVNVVPTPLVAIISGGNKVINYNTTWRLDASASYDPDKETGGFTYNWTCANLTAGTPTTSSCPTIANVSTLTFGALGVAPGTYQFTVTVSKTKRQAVSTTATVLLVKITPPTVSISPNGNLTVDPTNEFIFTGSILTYSGSVSYSWSLIRGVGSLASMVTTPLTQKVIKIGKNKLIPGGSYTIRFMAVDSNGVGYYDQKFYVNVPPRNGILTVSPTSGTNQDWYTVSMRNWLSDSALTSPLSYYFRYYQGTVTSSTIDSITTGYGCLRSKITSGTIRLQLPVGDSSTGALTIVGYAYDQYGSYATSFLTVTVTDAYSTVAARQSVAVYSSSVFSGNSTTKNDIQAMQDLHMLARLMYPYGDAQSYPAATCPNSCASQGACSSSGCVCNTGYTGHDCSLTTAELTVQQSVTSSIVYALTNATVSNIAMTPTMIEQALQTFLLLSSQPMAIGTTSLGIQFMTAVQKYITLAKTLGSVTQPTVTAVLGIASNLLDSVANSFRPNWVLTGPANAVTTTVALSFGDMAPGESLRSYSSNRVQVSVRRAMLTDVYGTTLRPPYVSGEFHGSFQIPSNMLQNITSQDSAWVVLSDWSKSPYISTNITTNILSIKFYDTSGLLSVTGLSSPVTIRMDASSEPATNHTLKCMYWSDKTALWGNDGCNVINSTGVELTCECNHLTFFAGEEVAFSGFTFFPTTYTAQAVSWNYIIIIALTVVGAILLILVGYCLVKYPARLHLRRRAVQDSLEVLRLRDQASRANRAFSAQQHAKQLKKKINRKPVPKPKKPAKQNAFSKWFSDVFNGDSTEADGGYSSRV